MSSASPAPTSGLACVAVVVCGDVDDVIVVAVALVVVVVVVLGDDRNGLRVEESSRAAVKMSIGSTLWKKKMSSTLLTIDC